MAKVPKELRLTAKRVEIERRGREVVLADSRPKSTAYGRKLVRLIQQIPPKFADIMETIDGPPPERITAIDENCAE